jgi:acetyl esterase/lipase
MRKSLRNLTCQWLANACLSLLVLLPTALFGGAPTIENRSLEALAELFSRSPQGNGLTISPEGDRFFAYVYRNGETGLVVVELDHLSGGLEKGRFLKPDPDFELSNPGWVTNDLIGFNKMVDDVGTIGYQIVSCDTGRNLLQYIELATDAKSRFFKSGAPDLGRRFFVQEGLKGYWGKRYPSVALLEIDKHMDVEEVVVWNNPGIIEDWYFIKDKPYAVIVDEETYTLDFDILEQAQMPQEEDVRAALVPLDLPGDIRLLIDENLALLSIEGEDGTHGMGWYNLNKGEILGKPIFVDGYDINTYGLRLRPGGAVIGLYYNTDRPKAVYMDADLRKVMKHLKESVSQGFPLYRGLSKDNRYVYYAILSDTHDTTYARFDLKTGENQPVYHTRPWLQGMDLPSRNPVTFLNRDGDTIHGYLTLPMSYSEGKPGPLVALSHGGPWVRDNWGFDEEAQFLASLGFAVLQVNYRGSTGYGDTYGLDEDLMRISRKSPYDVLDGVHWAIDQGYADPQRIALCGGSYGAYLSLFCAALEPELPACVIGVAGLYDFPLSYREDRFNERMWVEKLYSDFDEKAELWAELSPVNHADKIEASVLLIHGKRDSRVSTKQAKVMEKALKEQGVDVTYLKKVFMLHGFGNEKAKQDYYKEVGAFLLQHLGK